MTLLDFVIKHLRPNGKVEFLSLLPDDAVILDVGCGNNSPYRVKRIIPNSNYTGIDVGDHEQKKPNRAGLMNQEVLAAPTTVASSRSSSQEG
jgi:hypothetical protein